MPASFDACRKAGGKIRTKKIGESKYMRICIPKEGGPSKGGHVKKKKRRD